jgi:type II secretory pathway pseudopilin PulG
MRFATRPTSRAAVAGARPRSGFTLAEVLAALLFMAIVIPVAVEGLSVASRAGEVAQRKAAAARVAERVLFENQIVTNFSKAMQSGTIQDGQLSFNWTLRNEPWSVDRNTTAPHLLTAEVTFTVQGHDHTVRLSTLANAQ